jgi:hypothetical protein
MITFTQLTPAALDEAAAIVEAEWMRLQRQSAARVEDHFAEPTESPAPHMCTPGPPPSERDELATHLERNPARGMGNRARASGWVSQP